MYKFLVKDRNYTNWEMVPFFEKHEKEEKHNKEEKEKIIPNGCKLFHEDIIRWNKIENNEPTNEMIVLQSKVREKSFLSGILILKGNKTYGRRKNQTTNKTDKLLYKCIPNDTFLPSFLIPYEIKNMGFSKLFNNLYVTFKYDRWEEKHPYGTLLQVIGNVNELPNFYEYQLYCNNLHLSIHSFEKKTVQSIQKITEQNGDLFDCIKEKYKGNREQGTIEQGTIEQRTKENYMIFTIDPGGSMDFDDAFSIKILSKDKNKMYLLLSIYISNVAVVLDTLELWNSFSDRISTIYLPDRKRSMLPNILGDNLCSLREKTNRVAFTMDVFIEFSTENSVENSLENSVENSVKDNPLDKTLTIQKIEFKNTLVQVDKNYVYEEKSLLKNLNYQLLLDVTKSLSKNTYSYLPCINDSHDVVAYLMIWMNHTCSKELSCFNNGIFRCTSFGKEMEKTKIERKKIDDNAFFPFLTNQVGSYVNKEEVSSLSTLHHSALGLESYLHITSPIRRLVDLLNMIKLQENLKIITLSNESKVFYKKQLDRLEEINETMKKIRKVQNQSTLLELCTNHPEILEKRYEGYVFQKKEKEFGYYSYEVYIIDLKIISKITTNQEFEEGVKYLFQIYIFNHEETVKKKIRLKHEK